MEKNEINKELRVKESNLSSRYTMISKFLIFISLLSIIIFLALFMAIYIWNNPYNFAILSFSEWTIILSIILLISIFINFILYYKFGRFHDKIDRLEHKKTEFLNGKKVHTMTIPEGVEGGIFSKTFISIDSHNILRIRVQMIKPQELWKKEENIE